MCLKMSNPMLEHALKAAVVADSASCVTQGEGVMAQRTGPVNITEE